MHCSWPVNTVGSPIGGAGYTEILWAFANLTRAEGFLGKAGAVKPGIPLHRCIIQSESLLWWEMKMQLNKCYNFCSLSYLCSSWNGSLSLVVSMEVRVIPLSRGPSCFSDLSHIISTFHRPVLKLQSSFLLAAVNIYEALTVCQALCWALSIYCLLLSFHEHGEEEFIDPISHLRIFL